MSTIVEHPPVSARRPGVVIRASAGTGKTFQLANQYLARLRAETPVDRILATTFTRKAAGEILERVLLRLAEAAVDEHQCRELAGFLDDESLSRDDVLAMLTGLTGQLHRVQIGTLDSLFARIASSFALELGMPPNWRILEDVEDAQLRRRAVEAVLRSDATSDLVRMLNLINRGDAERSVARRIHDTVDSLYWVFLEAPESAWKDFPQPRFLSDLELAEAVEKLADVQLPNHKRWQSTRDRDLDHATAGEWEEFLGSTLATRAAAGGGSYCSKPIEEPVRDAYARLVQHARAVILAEVASQTEATHDLLARFHRLYGSLKHDHRGLRFDDVTRSLSRAFDGDVQRLVYRLDAGIDHLLLDEFQDTSLAQWSVIRPLARRVTRGDGDRSLFCVGDVKQAIYGWRGGVAEIFDALESEFDGLHRESLVKSFRSAPPVVETVNKIGSNLHRHDNLDDGERAVRDWVHDFQRHTTARTELDGYACLRTAPPADDEEKQLDATLRYAAQYVADLAARAPARTIGVLTRKNRSVARLVFELRRLGVQASEEGGNPLTDSAAVQLVLSLLQLADHPASTTERFHVARSPLGRALGFTDHGDDHAANRLAQQVRRRLIDEGYGPAVYGWARQLVDSCDRRELARLLQLVQLAYGYQPNASLRTRDFVEHVRRQSVSDPTNDPVRVMTIHQAKGLQFDTVVLPELDGAFTYPGRYVLSRPAPTEPPDHVCVYRNATVQSALPESIQQVFAQHTDRSTREALCVLYVAVTRPKHALHMIVAPKTKTDFSRDYAGLLRAALAPDDVPQPETVLYERGNPQWHRTAEQTPPAAPEPEPLTVRLAPMPDERRRGLERAAPSSREGARQVRLDDVLRLDNAVALERGTLIHAWFEQIEWLDDGWPAEETLRHVVDELGAASLDVEACLGQFRAMLGSPAVAWTLSRKSYQPPQDLNLPEDVLADLAGRSLRLDVERERRFAVRIGNTIVPGSIDRLVVMYDGTTPVAADVIDFKTDNLANADPETLRERVDYYRGQLEAYVPAVSRLYRLPRERISARLLLLSAGRVEHV